MHYSRMILSSDLVPFKTALEGSFLSFILFDLFELVNLSLLGCLLLERLTVALVGCDLIIECLLKIGFTMLLECFLSILLFVEVNLHEGATGVVPLPHSTSTTNPRISRGSSTLLDPGIPSRGSDSFAVDIFDMSCQISILKQWKQFEHECRWVHESVLCP